MPMIEMTLINYENLNKFVFNAFSAMGLNKKDAEIFTDALMFSELRFHSGQGQGVQRITTSVSYTHLTLPTILLV